MKYPRTYHLPWSEGATADDKTHSPEAVEDMFSGVEVVITEKMDGENTTIYASGKCHARSLDSVAHESRTWVRAKAAEMATLGLPEGWRLMGENCYAKHAIAYNNLPSYFILFGMCNELDTALPWDTLVEWASLLELPHAPVIWRGVWNAEEIEALYPFQSNYGEHVAEGYVVRPAAAFPMSEFRKNVAKFVRAWHVLEGSEHWMHQAVCPNELRTW